MMKYELRENQGIPAPLLALMAVATGLSVANCYYNQPLLGSMAKDFAVSDFSASMVATLTQIGYVAGLVFVIPLGDLVSRKKLILCHFSVRIACHSTRPEHLLGMGRVLACRSIFGYAAILHPVSVLPFSTCTQGAQCGDYTVLSAHRHSWLTCVQWLSCRCVGMAFRIFRGLRVYAWVFSDDSQDVARTVCSFSGKLCRTDEILVASVLQISVLAYRLVEGGIGLWLVLRIVELPCFPNEARAFLRERRYYRGTRFVRIGRCIYGCIH